MKTLKLQDDVRLIAKGGTLARQLFLVEEAPRHRLAYYGSKIYQLPMPWCYYVIIYNNMETIYKMLGHKNTVKNKAIVKTIYASPAKIRSKGGILDWLPVSNSIPHQVCDYGANVPPTSSRLKIINTAINSFWQANGGNYLGKTSPLKEQLEKKCPGPNHLNTYEGWENHSLEEMLGLEYTSIITMDKLITEITGNTLETIDGPVW